MTKIFQMGHKFHVVVSDKNKTKQLEKTIKQKNTFYCGECNVWTRKLVRQLHVCVFHAQIFFFLKPSRLLIPCSLEFRSSK